MLLMQSSYKTLKTMRRQSREISEKWLSAMAEELDALKSNDIWTVVMPPKGSMF